MSDPRWNIEDQPERELNTHRQPSRASTYYALPTQIETNRRREFDEEGIDEPAPTSIFATPQPTNPGTPNTPSAPVIDRFHKFGKVYVTVSPLHFSGDDPIPDPAAFHTINDGYTFAKSLADRLTDPDERVSLIVFAGEYDEDLTIDHPKVDLVGIGRPLISDSVWTITKDCTRVLVEGFEITNPYSFEGDDANDFAGIRVLAGVESGIHFSDVQIKRCLIHGPGTQLYLERWTDIESTDIYSIDTKTFGTPSIFVQFLLPVDVPPQSKWTQFRDCRISGEPFPGGILAPTYFDKGFAMQISAVDPGTGDWIPNVSTAASGVYLKNCIISGWTRNYGWNMMHSHCRHIEGDKLNDTSGSIHHYCVCWSGEGFGPSANTWFNHSEFNVRYCACIIDAGTIPGSWARTNVYLNHIIHNGPNHATSGLTAGGDVIDGGNLVPPQPVPQGFVFAQSYATAAPFVYGGPVELAIISMVTTGANLGIFTDIWEDT